MQSKIGSLVESLINILIGFGIALGSQILIFPMYGVNIPLHDNVMITLWFTLISIARSYTLRRLFNRITVWRMNRHATRN
jgi:hypothetical protein